MKKVLLVALAGFAAGYIANDLSNKLGLEVVGQAEAEVAGMDWSDLRYDYDFKKAVRSVVEGSCQADDDGYISC